MKIYGARYDRGELHLRCDPPDGMKFAMTFKDGDYEILPIKKKKHRSLSANSYSWIIIDKIAERVGLSPEEVYQNAIKDMAGISEDPEKIPIDELDSYVRKWIQNHLGRRVKVYPDERSNWYVNVIRVHGSSDFNTTQMAHFIDNLIQDAKELGIDVMTEKERSRLLDAWAPR